MSCLESATSTSEKKYKLNRVYSSGDGQERSNVSERCGLALKLSKSLSGKQDLLERILKHRSAVLNSSTDTRANCASSMRPPRTAARGLREKNLNIIEESNELLGSRYLTLNYCSPSPININRKLMQLNKYLDQNNNLLSNTNNATADLLLFDSHQISNNVPNLSASLSSLALAAVKATQIATTATMSKALMNSINERSPLICKESTATFGQDDSINKHGASLTPMRNTRSSKEKNLSVLFTRKSKSTASSTARLNSSLNNTNRNSAASHTAASVANKCISSSIFNFNSFKSHFQK
jgi:hypothetical protein